MKTSTSVDKKISFQLIHYNYLFAEMQDIGCLLEADHLETRFFPADLPLLALDLILENIDDKSSISLVNSTLLQHTNNCAQSLAPRLGGASSLKRIIKRLVIISVSTSVIGLTLFLF